MEENKAFVSPNKELCIQEGQQTEHTDVTQTDTQMNLYQKAKTAKFGEECNVKTDQLWRSLKRDRKPEDGLPGLGLFK